MARRVVQRSWPRSHAQEATSADRFIVRARPLAIWSLTFAFSCLATIAVLLATGDDDPLATIALALAIFAFALQIGFFIVQMRVAAEQDRRSADLYRDTSAVLTKIDERSSATVAVIREQFDFVLRHALGQTPARAVADIDGDTTETPGEDAKEEPEEDVDGDTGSHAATPAEIEAIVSRVVQSSLGSEALSQQWRQIASPVGASSRERAEAKRLSKLHRQEATRLIRAALAGRDDSSYRVLDPFGHAVVVDRGEARGVVLPRRWSDDVPLPLLRRHAERAAETAQEAGASTAVIVVPEGVLSGSEDFARRFVKETNADVEVLSIDEFADLLAHGWPATKR